MPERTNRAVAPVVVERVARRVARRGTAIAGAGAGLAMAAMVAPASVGVVALVGLAAMVRGFHVRSRAIAAARASAARALDWRYEDGELVGRAADERRVVLAVPSDLAPELAYLPSARVVTRAGHPSSSMPPATER